ncbi:MAG: LamB/YcsF family protein, partial [Acidimicrobiales bacterium]
ALASEHEVSVGAHPGLPDLLGFGRRRIDVSPADVRSYVLYQLGALSAFAGAAGTRLHHVKAHGALYMMVLDDPALAAAMVDAVAAFDDRLPIYTLAGSEAWDAAESKGLRPVPEFFADRPMRRDGSVVMFRWWEHFDATPDVVGGRVAELVTTGRVTSIEGPPVKVHAETVCVHSDTPRADELGPAVRAAFDHHGVAVSSALAAS